MFLNKKSHYYGMYLFWTVALLALPIWWMSYPETTVKHNFSSFHVYSSQITALLGFSFFALSFVLSTRLKILEDLFGGLDKVYHSSEATHTSVFQELQKVMPSFSMHLVCRDRDGFVKMGDIVMKDIFICGPKEMRKALLSESKKLNIWRKNILSIANTVVSRQLQG